MKPVENSNEKIIVNNITLYLNEISKYPLLSKTEERDLLIKYKNGDLEAKDKLINSNLKLVVSMVKSYIHFYNISDQNNFLDLIQEGNIGILLALEKFDINKNVEFATYAYYWIRKTITAYMREHNYSIKTPYCIIEDLNKMNINQKYFNDIYGKEPNIEDYQKELGFTKSKITALMNIKKEIISLQTPIMDDETVELIEHIKDNKDIIEESNQNISIFNFLRKTKKILTDREYKTLLCRMGIKIDGIGSDKVMTLDELGKKFEVTGERIRKIQEKVSDKIKYNFKNELESLFPDKTIDKTKIKKYRIKKQED